MIKSACLRVVPAMAALLIAGSANAVDLGKVMFVGNSIVESHISDNLTWAGGYRKVIEDRLISEGHKFQFVGSNDANSAGMANPLHNGYGGKYLPEVLTGVNFYTGYKGSISDWMVKDTPDVVVLDMGRGTPGVTIVEDMKNLYGQFLTKVFEKNKDARVVLVTQHMSDSRIFGGAKAEVDLANAGLLAAVKDYKAKGFWIDVADTRTVWNFETDLDDIVHPNDAGFLKLGKVIGDTLINSSKKPVPEPSLLIFGASVAAIAWRRRRSG